MTKLTRIAVAASVFISSFPPAGMAGPSMDGRATHSSGANSRMSVSNSLSPSESPGRSPNGSPQRSIGSPGQVDPGGIGTMRSAAPGRVNVGRIGNDPRSGWSNPDQDPFAGYGHNGWLICNRHEEEPIVNVAVVTRGEMGWETHGWLRVRQGRCVRATDTSDAEVAYYFAYGDITRTSGNRLFCVDPSASFSIASSDRCAPDQVRVGFTEVNLNPGSYQQTNLR